MSYCVSYLQFFISYKLRSGVGTDPLSSHSLTHLTSDLHPGNLHLPTTHPSPSHTSHWTHNLSSKSDTLLAPYAPEDFGKNQQSRERWRGVSRGVRVGGCEFGEGVGEESVSSIMETLMRTPVTGGGEGRRERKNVYDPKVTMDMRHKRVYMNSNVV